MCVCVPEGCTPLYELKHNGKGLLQMRRQVLENTMTGLQTVNVRLTVLEVLIEPVLAHHLMQDYTAAPTELGTAVQSPFR